MASKNGTLRELSRLLVKTETEASLLEARLKEVSGRLRAMKAKAKSLRSTVDLMRQTGVLEVDDVMAQNRFQRAGRIGAAALHATHDPKETTAKARATFLASFEHQVDPDGVLPPQERARRAEQARRAHFLRMAAKSAKVRAARKQLT